MSLSPIDLYQEFEKDVQDPDTAQQQTLAKILECHQQTHHLQRLKLDGSSTVDEFRAKHPVTDYSFYQPVIEAVVAGERPHGDIVGDQLVSFVLTSGTTGSKSKYIPRNAATSKSFTEGYQLFVVALTKAGALLDPKAKAIAFSRAGKVLTTPCGLSAAGSTTLQLHSPIFRPFFEADASAPFDLCLVPTTSLQCMYGHLLCGLLMRDKIGFIRANFASIIQEAILTLEAHWPDLVNHIRTGEAPEDPSLTNEDTRVLLQPRIAGGSGGDPALADELEAIFEEGMAGALTKLFPNCTMVSCITTGAMAQFLPLLRRFTGPDFPIVTPLYISSESMFAMNLDLFEKDTSLPEPCYTFLPRMGFFEFIPVAQAQALGEEGGTAGHDVPGALQLSEVQLGEEYEVVVTTWGGLCRYRMKDVVKVMGFEGRIPKVQFLRRSGAVLSIHSERTTETMLHAALAAAVKEANAALPDSKALRLLNFTSSCHLESLPQHYNIFCEFVPGAGSSTAYGVSPKAGAGFSTANGVSPKGGAGFSTAYGISPKAGAGSTLPDGTSPRAARARSAVEPPEISQGQLEQMASTMDLELQRLNVVYGADRAAGKLGATCLHVLKPGTFQRYQRHKVDVDGTDPQQFKMPACIASPVLANMVQESILGCAHGK